MDELLGFGLSSKKIDDMCNRIDAIARSHRFDEAILIAKDAIVIYPHTFKVLYTCADLYYYKFLESKEQKDSEDAISLVPHTYDLCRNGIILSQRNIITPYL
ncbi:MAG: hypothetical protein J6Y89_04475 [Lachnospiraceae bacterium]|nr:hypothetical protein [Lachnospiraceae bacterium]